MMKLSLHLKQVHSVSLATNDGEEVKTSFACEVILMLIVLALEQSELKLYFFVNSMIFFKFSK